MILGALLADTPHTRPVPVSGAAYSPESAKFFGLEEIPLRGAHRHRRGVPGRLRGRRHPCGDVLGGRPALRARSRPIPRPPSRCCAGSRTFSTSRCRWRLACAGRGVGAGGHRDDRRRRGDRRVRGRPSSSAATPRSTSTRRCRRSTATRWPRSSSAICAGAVPASGADSGVVLLLGQAAVRGGGRC